MPAVGFGADFQLELGVALIAVHRDFGRHRLGRDLLDGAVELDLPLSLAAEKLIDRQSRRLAQNVPAGHVDPRLDVRVPAQDRVHVPVQGARVPGVEADDPGRKLGQARADAERIGRKIGRPERAALAIAGDPGVGLDLNYGRVEDIDVVAVRPALAALLQGQVHLIGTDRGDLHEGLSCGRDGGRVSCRRQSGQRNWRITPEEPRHPRQGPAR